MISDEDRLVGQWLYASCSAVTYGRILRVGIDANEQAVMDIELQDPDDLSDAPCLVCAVNDDNCAGHPSMLHVELSAGATIVLRDVAWRYLHGDMEIECRTPGNEIGR